ncbi:MAG TPA: signal peptidase I [Longimicrobium sp.]|nr:signal peptidase I [Longimicrobium sp.]
MSTVSTSRTRGTAEPKSSAKRTPDQPPRNELVEWAKSIGAALLLFLVIRTFVVQAYSIPSNSMEQTLLVGDYLMANNAIFGARLPLIDTRLPAFRDPHAGEIAVFRPTYNNPQEDVVKRVIGIPGDTLEGKNGTVWRNGKPLREPYVQRQGNPDGEIGWDGRGGVPPEVIPERYGYHTHLPALLPTVDKRTYRPTRDNWGPLVVPRGHYWMMGDNREESLDSRFMGFIPREVIRGKPLFIYFSVDKGRDTPFPHFLTAARWGRIGTGIRACCAR